MKKYITDDIITLLFKNMGECMKLSKRKLFIIAILVLCIIAINLAVYFQITKKPTNVDDVPVDEDGLMEEFNSIFDNSLDVQGNSVNVTKIDNLQELIYTSYTNQEVLENSYELNVYLPSLNISNPVAQAINEEINRLFYDKVISVLAQSNKYTIYSVNYKAYINNDILSLIIKATLKEGDNPQRILIKTYNYNLTSNQNLNISEILNYRKINQEFAQSKINETVQHASENANRYKNLGYNIYLRDINNSIYKISNTQVFFLGKNNALYIVYPYGNSNYTSEVDLLII